MTYRTSFALVLLLAAALAPDRAHAQQTDPETFWGVTLGVGIPMLAVDAIFVGEAIDKAMTDGHGLYELGAILEIAWGAFHIAGAGVAIGVSSLAYDPAPLALTFGVPLALVGGYFLAHGIASLIEPPGGGRNDVYVSVGPSERGAMALVGGAF
jgi:hypothetical protein